MQITCNLSKGVLFIAAVFISYITTADGFLLMYSYCRGVLQIGVTFEIDAHGILHVKAKDKAIKKSESITIANDKGRLSRNKLKGW